MVTWAEIQSWKSTSLSDVLDGLIAKRRDAFLLVELIEKILKKAPSWKGRGRSSADSALKKLHDKALYSLTCIGEALTATSIADDGLSQVELLVNEASSRASAYGFVISQDGSSVTDPTPSVVSNGSSPYEQFAQKLERKKRLQECRDAVAQALAKAREVDKAFVSALQAIANGEVKVTEGLDDTPGLPDFPASDASTEEVSTWWAALTDSEKNAILANNELFHRLGNMNGIPASIRHEANLDAMREDYDKYRKIRENYLERIEQAQNRPERHYSLFPTSEEEYAIDRLREIEKLRESLNMSTEEFSQSRGLRNIEQIRQAHSNRGDDARSLLVYELPTKEKGNTKTHAAVAIGNVDTATHVSTFIPGLNTNVESNILGYTDQMQQLQNRTEAILAENRRGHEKVATIAWQAYDTPGFGTVASTERAQIGGDKLRNFIEGYTDAREAQGNPRAHTSVLGHSYGSTTSSSGMLDVRPGVVDDFAMFGSPGYEGGSTHRGYLSGAPLTPQAGSWDFNVPRDHTYAMRYSSDIIHGTTGVLGIDPMDDPHIKHLDAGSTRHGLNFIKTHGEYLEEGTRAREHLARIIGGFQP